MTQNQQRKNVLFKGYGDNRSFLEVFDGHFYKTNKTVWNETKRSYFFVTIPHESRPFSFNNLLAMHSNFWGIHTNLHHFRKLSEQVFEGEPLRKLKTSK